MSEDEKYYSASSYGDRLTPGKSIKIEHSVSFVTEKADISELATLSIEKLQEMRTESIGMEQAVYDELLESAREWEKYGARTMLIDKAIEHIKVPVVAHSSNKWVVNDNHYHSISNMVYKMSYHIYEHTKYDRALGKSVPCAWDATWSVHMNIPISNEYNRGGKIAGQDKKRFTDKAACEKYLQGRIAAHTHLFAEISPPLPPEYVKSFKVNGLLLPGYTVAGEGAASVMKTDGEKPSVLGMIAEAREEQRRTKTDNRDKPPSDRKNKTEPEL